MDIRHPRFSVVLDAVCVDIVPDEVADAAGAGPVGEGNVLDDPQGRDHPGVPVKLALVLRKGDRRRRPDAGSRERIDVAVPRIVASCIELGYIRPFREGELDEVGPVCQVLEEVPAVCVRGGVRPLKLILAHHPDQFYVDIRHPRFSVVLDAVCVDIVPDEVADAAGAGPVGEGNVLDDPERRDHPGIPVKLPLVLPESDELGESCEISGCLHVAVNGVIGALVLRRECVHAGRTKLHPVLAGRKAGKFIGAVREGHLIDYSPGHHPQGDAHVRIQQGRFPGILDAVVIHVLPRGTADTAVAGQVHPRCQGASVAREVRPGAGDHAGIPGELALSGLEGEQGRLAEDLACVAVDGVVVPDIVSRVHHPVRLFKPHIVNARCEDVREPVPAVCAGRGDRHPNPARGGSWCRAR